MSRTLGCIEEQPFGSVCPIDITGFLEQLSIRVEQFMNGTVFIPRLRCVCFAPGNELVTDGGTGWGEANLQFGECGGESRI